MNPPLPDCLLLAARFRTQALDLVDVGFGRFGHRICRIVERFLDSCLNAPRLVVTVSSVRARLCPAGPLKVTRPVQLSGRGRGRRGDFVRLKEVTEDLTRQAELFEFVGDAVDDLFELFHEAVRASAAFQAV